MLSVAALLAALVAGLTGAWSPCGFSMVETLAPQGYAGRVRTTLVACATFSAGALAGGVATFGGLSLLGRALGAGAPAVAAVLATVAALGEARGARILPQVRRQVPESWRRVLPVPLAAGLYGILLGLGFTTFILTFAVWALAGIAVAIGDPHVGLLVGLGFGAGRALPVVALAPAGGGRLHAAMAERPRILRSLRLADAAALIVLAGALATGTAQAAATEATGVSDPSADGTVLALHRPAGPGILREDGSNRNLPGSHPAVGGGLVAWLADATVHVTDRRTGAAVATVPAPGADALAVSSTWVAWRAGTDLWAAALPAGTPARVVHGRDPGRPALDGAHLVFDVGETRIEDLDLRTGARRTLRRERRSQLRTPSARGGTLVYVRARYTGQELVIGPRRPGAVAKDRLLYGTTPTGRRDLGYEPGHEHAPGHRETGLWARPPAGVSDTLWTTALGSSSVWVTRLRQRAGQPVQPAILRVPR